MYRKILAVIPVIIFFSCSDSENQSPETEELELDHWNVVLEELLGPNYPDNPDASIWHSDYEEVTYKDVEIIKESEGIFSFKFNPDEGFDTISLNNLKIEVWIPTICEKVKDDAYLSEIAIINQEWNRHQIKFNSEEFLISGTNQHQISRVDLARNCLNSYLWEVIVYAEEDSIQRPWYHGWFDFPSSLYAELFEQINDKNFNEYSPKLEDWIDPENRPVDLSTLRKIKDEQIASFNSLNHKNYPLSGERKKKFVNILYPENTTRIQDFLTDSTLFATFSPPGFYNTKDPRKTELSRLAHPDSIYKRITENDLLELEVVFNSNLSNETHLIISGIDTSEIPVLTVDQANNGWQNSMGFGNHTFYETYKSALQHPSKSSNYFAILTNNEKKWIDSHAVGIDGPLFHFDKNNRDLLHLWVLSFERHAFVGHFEIQL